MSENILKSSGLVLLNSVNYNQWQYEQFRPYVGKTVLEIGCGLGNLTQYLQRDTDFLLSVDTQPEAISFISKRCPPSDQFRVELLNVFEEGLKEYRQKPFDTIVFSNVLEHIENDTGAMKMCHDILAPTQGQLLLLVPAHPFLYGTLDEESGHCRRYSKKAIEQLAHTTGFKILDLYAFNIIGALGWFINYCVLRRKGSNNTPADTQVDLYDRYLVKPGRWFESIVRPPLGISYIAILEVQKGT